MSSRLIPALLLCLGAGLCLPLGAAEPASEPEAAPQPAATTESAAAADGQTATTPKAAPPAQVNLEDVRRFTAVLSLVKQAYVEPVDDHVLMQAAIRGMLLGLDPHSEYLEPEALSELSETTSGSYAGIGIEVTTVDGSLRVIAPIDDTPAARAGLKPGDIILRIDQTPVQNDNLADAVDLLRGAPGSKVSLSVLHPGETVPQDYTLERARIHVASVRGRLLEPGYAYLRISQFQAETGADLRQRIQRLRDENKGALKGAVLDLRSNPGGLLNSAVEVSDLFLEAGAIVTTRGRIAESEMSFRANAGDALQGAPLVVLIDNGSASAAEIVAGALKDNHRALLMGQRSFGKGSVQTVLMLDDTHAVKLTTARYFTPSGVSIQAAGIEPDIALADLSLSRGDSAPPTLRESDLRNHLRGEREASADDAHADANEAAPKDYALNEALNALKALALQRRPAPAPTQG